MKLLLLSENMGAVIGFLPPGCKIGAILTAAETSLDPSWTKKYTNALQAAGFIVTEIDVSNQSQSALTRQITEADALFVGGGNTFYLMQQIRKAGIFDALREAILAGKYYIGSSAGSAICGPTIQPIETLDDPAEAPQLTSFDGLDVFDYVVLPHAGTAEFAEGYRQMANRYGKPAHFLFFRDDQAILVSGRSDYQLVQS